MSYQLPFISRIPLIPLTLYFRIPSLPVAWTTVLENITNQISSERALKIHNIYIANDTITGRYCSFRVIQNDEIQFVATTDYKHGSLFSHTPLPMLATTPKLATIKTSKALIISDKESDLQTIQTGGTVDLDATLVYNWIPNKYHIQERPEVGDIKQLGGQMGDASAGNEFYQVGDRFKVDL